MAESVQAWKSDDGRLFDTEAEAIRHNIIEAASEVIAPLYLDISCNPDSLLLVGVIRTAIAELYDKCGWRPVS